MSLEYVSIMKTLKAVTNLGCTPVKPELAEVALANPTMQAVQDSWKRPASGTTCKWGVGPITQCRVALSTRLEWARGAPRRPWMVTEA